MSPLVKDILIKGLMAGTAARQVKKTSVGLGYYALAGGVACLALIFFSLSGNAYLKETYPDHIADAMTGSILLLLSLAIGMFGYYGMHKKKLAKKTAPHDGSFVDMVESTVKSVLEGFEEPVKDNPKMALLMAALAGFAAGDKLNDRVH